MSAALEEITEKALRLSGKKGWRLLIAC